MGNPTEMATEETRLDLYPCCVLAADGPCWRGNYIGTLAVETIQWYTGHVLAAILNRCKCRLTHSIFPWLIGWLLQEKWRAWSICIKIAFGTQCLSTPCNKKTIIDSWCIRSLGSGKILREKSLHLLQVEMTCLGFAFSEDGWEDTLKVSDDGGCR